MALLRASGPQHRRSIDGRLLDRHVVVWQLPTTTAEQWRIKDSGKGMADWRIKMPSPLQGVPGRAYPKGCTREIAMQRNCTSKGSGRRASATNSEPGKYTTRVKFIPPEWSPGYATGEELEDEAPRKRGSAERCNFRESGSDDQCCLQFWTYF